MEKLTSFGQILKGHWVVEKQYQLQKHLNINPMKHGIVQLNANNIDVKDIDLLVEKTKIEFGYREHSSLVYLLVKRLCFPVIVDNFPYSSLTVSINGKRGILINKGSQKDTKFELAKQLFNILWISSENYQRTYYNEQNKQLFKEDSKSKAIKDEFANKLISGNRIIEPSLLEGPESVLLNRRGRFYTLVEECCMRGLISKQTREVYLYQQ